MKHTNWKNICNRILSYKLITPVLKPKFVLWMHSITMAILLTSNQFMYVILYPRQMWEFIVQNLKKEKIMMMIIIMLCTELSMNEVHKYNIIGSKCLFLSLSPSPSRYHRLFHISPVSTRYTIYLKTLWIWFTQNEKSFILWN